MDNRMTTFLLIVWLGMQFYLASGVCYDNELGMANGYIMDNETTSSSSQDASTTAKNGRLNYTAGSSWCAGTNDTSPYLQIDLQVRHIICAVSTQGNSKADQWVKTYKLQSSNDGETWSMHKEQGLNKTFLGNFDRETIVKNVLHKGIVTRYLRFIPQKSYAGVCLRVELYGLPFLQENLAFFKPTSQSSTGNAFISSNAVDGSRNTEIAKCTHTIDPGSLNPWWRVDLGQVKAVSELFIVNRNSNGDRLNGFNITVENMTNGGAASSHLCDSGLSVPTGQGKYFQCKQVLYGSFVYIRLPGNSRILTLCEVEVYRITNLALRRSSAQSSTTARGTANRAVDGRPSNQWLQNSCTHTKAEKDPWWRVDLGSFLPVAEVFIVNRDCPGGGSCGNRLKGFQILIGDNSQNGGVSNAPCGGPYNLNNAEMKSFYCVPRLFGRYVFIRIPGNGKTLTICELEVYQRRRAYTACTGQSVGIRDSSIIPDYRFSASSSRGGNEPSEGRLRGSKAWVPSTNNNADDYLQIDLGSVYFVCAVETQGNPATNEWTKTYKIKISSDNVKWTNYQEGNVEKIFTGNSDRNSIVRSELHLSAPVKFIRIYPVSFSEHKALRVEVNGVHAGCQTSLGFEDNSLLDSQISASSVADASHNASSGRLYNSASWCSSTASSSEYLQVDLRQVMTVTGVATQGDPSSNKLVTLFMMRFGHQDKKWLREMNLRGNKANNEVTVNWFTQSIEARFVQFVPLSWQNGVCMRIELYGCSQLKQVPLPTVTGLQDQHLEATRESYVVLTCNVSGVRETFIRWESNGQDINNLSSGILSQGNSLTTSMKVNFTDVSEIVSTWNCTRKSHSTRNKTCVKEFACLAFYSSLAGGGPVQQKAVVSTRLVVPAAVSTLTADSIQGTSAIIRWKAPTLGGTGEAPVTAYELQIRNKNNPSSQQYINVSATAVFYYLEGLSRNTNYEVNMKAISIVGRGLRSSLPAKFKTARTVNCEETVLGKETGFFSDMIVSSSQYNTSTPPFQASLLVTDRVPWCANDSDHSPYVQVDLREVYIICAISTQGNHNGNQWVETYQLESSLDGTSWTDYKEGKQPRIFLGNYDSTSVVKQELYSGVVCRKLRLLIKTFNGLACLKVRLFGIKADVDNLALYKPTSQSSTTASYVSSNAVDGNKDTMVLRCTHTDGSGSTDPWWRVDLGQVEPVSELFIVNRGDCCGGRLSGFEIRVGNKTTRGVASNHLCGGGLSVPQGEGKSFPCNPAVYGRFVFITIPGNNKILTLCEVEVYKRSNLALMQPALQSSTFNSHGTANKAVDGQRSNTWSQHSCSLTNTERNPWWRVDLGSSFLVGEVFIVNRGDCGGTCGDRFKGFEIRIGNDDKNGGLSNKQCGGLYDLNKGEMKSFYCDPRLFGRYVYIRIPGDSKTLTICELEVYSRGRIERACSSQPVGLADSSIIPDHRFIASSSRGGNEPFKGRLRASNAWVPKNNNNADDYLQIDLGSVYFVCGVATQGNPTSNEWSKTFKIETSLDNANWTTYKENNVQKIFDGNKDNTKLRRNSLRTPPLAKFIRFYPIDYSSSKSFRVEVYGYAQGSKSPAGLENGDVLSTQITASSKVGDSANGRLYGSSSWCSSTSASSEYLQVDLGRVKTVTGMATQGSPLSDQWVTEYSISFSYRKEQWIPFTAYSSKLKILTGNDGRNSLQVNWIVYPFVARYLRIYPQTWNSAICLRIESYASSYVNTPIIRPPLGNRTLPKSMGSSVMLSCTVYGIPHVTVTWNDNGGDITNASIANIAYSVNGKKSWEKIVTNLTLFYSNASYAKSQFHCLRVSRQSRILRCQEKRLTCSALYSGSLLQTSSTAWVRLADDLHLPEAPSQPEISNITSTSVAVSWNRTQAGDGSLLGYTLSYNSSEQQTVVNFTAVTFSTLLSRLQPYTVYSVRVQMISTIGLGLQSPQKAFRTYLPAKIYMAVPDEIKLSLGQRNVSFVCYGEGYPMPTVLWKKDGNAGGYATISMNVSSTNSSTRLEIRPEGVTYQDAGNYTCEVYNGVDGQRKISHKLEVIFFPEFVITPSDTIVLEGATAILNCEASGVPEPKLKWTLLGSNGLPNGSMQLSNGSLVIPNVRNTPEYEDVYNCTAFSRAGVRVVQAWLTVWVPPRFLALPRDAVLTVDSTLNLTCLASGDPFPQISWFKDGWRNISRARITQRNTSLVIMNVTISDEGIYECRVNNRAGDDTSTAKVVVHAPVDVHVPQPHLVKLNRGDLNISIECYGYGKPTPAVLWKRYGVPVAIVPEFNDSCGNDTVQVIRKGHPTDWNVITSLYLRTDGITYHDAGEFVCEGHNTAAGNSSERTSVEIVFFPEFNARPRNKIALVDSNVTFACNASGVPRPTITWSFDGGRLPNFVATNDTLTLFRVQNSDSFEGNYTCNASNRAGWNALTVTLTVDVPPRIIHLKNLSLMVYSNLNLTCNVYGDPAPKVYWMKEEGGIIPNGQFFHDNKTLLINAVDIDVDGAYTCVAVNRAGNSSSTARVDVLMEPAISITPPLQLKLRRQEKNTTVDCRGYGKPVPVIRWLRNGVQIPAFHALEPYNNSFRVFQVTAMLRPETPWNVSSRLFIAPAGISYREAGVYSCEVYNSIEGKSTVNETIKVLFRPEIFVWPKKKIVVEGGNTSMHCYASGVPRPIVTWIYHKGPKTKESVTSDNTTSNSTLLVIMTQNSDLYEGNYTCNASSIVGMETKTAEIVVDVPPWVVSPLKDISLLVTSKLNLTCDVKGDPAPSVLWLKDESDVIPRAVFLQKNKTLVIYSVEIADEGRYKCVLRNRAGNTTHEAYVEIKVPPQLLLSSAALILRRNERNVTVDCYGYGKPLPIVTWRKGNESIRRRNSTLTTNGRNGVMQMSFNTSGRPWNITTRLYLRTNGITYEEAGNYSCEVFNGVGGNVSTDGTVRVFFLPEFVKRPKDQIVLKGQNATFPCRASGVPEPTISWLFSGGDLANFTREGDNLRLLLVKNNEEYEGNYTCKASNGAGSDEDTAQLTVYVPPQIVHSLNETVVAERGSTVVLSCSASGDPTPHYYWTKDGSLWFPNAEFKDLNKTLELIEVDSKDDGVYSCFAISDAGSVVTRSNVTIHAKPQLKTGLPDKVHSTEGQTVGLNCSGEAIPSPRVEWLKGGQTVINDGNFVIRTAGKLMRTTILTIISVKYEDRGEYTCFYSNNRGMVNSTGLLIVYVPANITQPPLSSIKMKIGLRVTLNCSARGFPFPSFTWIKDGTGLNETGRVETSEYAIAETIKRTTSLTISSLTRKDTGTYLCKASNLAGNSSKTANLIVLEKPDRMKLSVVSSTSRTVEIKWTVLFTGNSPVLHYSIIHNSSYGNVTFNTSSSHQIYNVSRLKPATLYTFWVTATNELGTSLPATASQTTLEAEPEAPEHLKALSINSTSIYSNWTTPNITNGILTMYVVYYDRTDVFASLGTLRLNYSLRASLTWLVIEGLDPFTNYTVRVQAFTLVGGGNLSEPFGPVLTDQDVPEAPYDISEEWQPDKETFLITWKTPSRPHGLITGYKIYLLVDNVVFPKVKNKMFETEGTPTYKSVAVQNLNGGKEYKVVVQGRTSKGFGRNSTEEVVLATPSKAPPEPSQPPIYYVNDTTDTTAVIKLVEFSNINGRILFYQVVNLRVPKGTEDEIPEPKDVKPTDALPYEDAHVAKTPVSYVAFQFKGDDFNKYRRFILGNEKTLNRERRQVVDYYNGPLHPDTQYRAFTRAFTSQTLYSQSQYAKISTKPPKQGTPSPSPTSPSSLGGVVTGVVVAIVLLIVAAVVIIYVRRKRRDSLEAEEENELQPFPQQSENSEGSIINEGFKTYDELPPPPIPVKDLKKHYLLMHADNDYLFAEEYKIGSSVRVVLRRRPKWKSSSESGTTLRQVLTNVKDKEETKHRLAALYRINFYDFQSIRISGSPTTKACDLPENKVKNRYANIKAYDHSRVVLEREGDSDYINANYIDGYDCPRQYIATIGPKAATASDFWWMIWQENTSVIVMLTRPVEQGKDKCYRYWPNLGTTQYGPLTVTLKQVEELAEFEIRTLSLQMPSRPDLKPRVIAHFYFTAWPDHDVPDNATGLLQFWKRVKKVATDNSPVVVHCSAGVGRTGTFIVIDAMMKQIADSETLDIYNYVIKIREQRNMMVQRQSQYAFVYSALLEATAFGDSEIAVHDLRIKMKKLGERNPQTNQTSFEREFNLLDGVIPTEKMDFTSAVKTENAEKNRYANVLPYDRNRVVLSSTSSDKDTTYINASFLEGFQERKAYIATQAPLENTAGDFWRMVWEHNVYCIVVLGNLKDDMEVPLVNYWSEKEATCYGSLTVETTEVDSKSNYIVLSITLTDTKTSEARRITHFKFSNWPKDAAPCDPSSVLDLIRDVQKVQQQSGNHSIVVHCSDGIGRTGTFCALNTCIESVKLENTFDVFTVVRLLRIQRPGMVQTLAQYRFIYDAIVAYLDSFESAMYQNFQ